MIKFILKRHWYLAPLGILILIHNIFRISYSIFNYTELENPILNILSGSFLIILMIIMYIMFIGEYLYETGQIDENGNIKSQSKV